MGFLENKLKQLTTDKIKEVSKHQVEQMLANHLEETRSVEAISEQSNWKFYLTIVGRTILKNQYKICDSNKHVKYRITRSGKQDKDHELYVYNLQDDTIAYLSIDYTLPGKKYAMYIQGKRVASVKLGKQINPLKSIYSIGEKKWTVEEKLFNELKVYDNMKTEIINIKRVFGLENEELLIQYNFSEHEVWGILFALTQM